MAVILNATAGHAAANSYVTEMEADAYFAARVPLSPPWADAADPTAALAMAARVLDRMGMGHRYAITINSVTYYRTRPRWTGRPTTTTQRMAWPRTGMLDGNGNAIATNAIPRELKEAQCELAGQLLLSDRTLDNEAAAQGISSVKAGSVSVSFKDLIEAKVVPDAVWALMPPSWFTDETQVPALTAEFDVVS